MGLLGLYGAVGIIWGCWNYMGLLELYGDVGIIWGCWNYMGLLEQHFIYFLLLFPLFLFCFIFVHLRTCANFAIGICVVERAC